MIALHPPLSGMPLAFVLLLACVEAVRISTKWRERLSVTQSVLVFATGVASVAAFLSGYQASALLGDLSVDVQSALGQHHALGRLLLINAILMVTFFVISRVAVHGRRLMCFFYVLALCLQVGLSLWVGYLGGSLVFDRGLGVHGFSADSVR